MAIDSAEKRRSAGGVPFLPLGPGVTPDVDQGAAWRASAAWGYSGVAPGPPEPPDGDGNAFWLIRHRRRRRAK